MLELCPHSVHKYHVHLLCASQLLPQHWVICSMGTCRYCCSSLSWWTLVMIDSTCKRNVFFPSEAVLKYPFIGKIIYWCCFHCCGGDGGGCHSCGEEVGSEITLKRRLDNTVCPWEKWGVRCSSWLSNDESQLLSLLSERAKSLQYQFLLSLLLLGRQECFLVLPLSHFPLEDLLTMSVNKISISKFFFYNSEKRNIIPLSVHTHPRAHTHTSTYTHTRGSLALGQCILFQDLGYYIFHFLQLMNWVLGVNKPVWSTP